MKTFLPYVCAALFLLFSMCENEVKPNTTVPLTVKDLRVSGQINGWVENTAAFKEFTAATLYLLIDGGDFYYKEAGLVDGIYQILRKPVGTDTLPLEIYTENYGNAANAQTIFDTITNKNVQNSVTFEGYPPITVLGNKNDVGRALTVYAHFNRFYFELTFNYGPIPVDTAIAEAKKFLAYYKSKINNRN